MTMRLPDGVRLAAAVALAACRRDADAPVADRAPAPPARYGFGHPVDSARLAVMNVDVDTAGHGLPAGAGTPTQGAGVYAQKCAVCHGASGEGQATYPKLIGPAAPPGFAFASDPKIPKTIGNYWPYATTLYDYIHRAMPLTAPGSLTPDQTYAVTAFLLSREGIIPPGTTLDAKSLAAIQMPAKSHFVVDDRRGSTGGKHTR
jgi:cytochrome c